MKELDIKATIYDIFGYLIPGLILTVIMIIAYGHLTGAYGLSYITRLIKPLSAKEITLLLFLAYTCGHALSTLSSIIIEKNIIFNFNLFSAPLTINTLLSEGLKDKVMDKFKTITDVHFSDKDFRYLITYVESKQSAVYATAFVYLAFYGMARSISFTFGLGLFLELFNVLFRESANSIYFAGAYFGLALIFGYHYYRFLRYFRQQIIFGFILPNI